MKPSTLDIDLSRTAIFAGIPEDKIAKSGRTRKGAEFSGGQQIMKEGETGNSLFILLSGEVEVTKLLCSARKRHRLILWINH